MNWRQDCCGRGLLVGMLLAGVAFSLSPAIAVAHGQGQEMYLKDQPAGPYLITAWVDLPYETERHTEPAEVIVQVKDAASGEPVTDATVIVALGLPGPGQEPQATLGPYLAPDNINRSLGIYGVTALLERIEPWVVFISVSRPGAAPAKGETYFQLIPDGDSGSGWWLVGGGLGGGSVALLILATTVRRARRESHANAESALPTVT